MGGRRTGRPVRGLFSQVGAQDTSCGAGWVGAPSWLVHTGFSVDRGLLRVRGGWSLSVTGGVGGGGLGVVAGAVAVGAGAWGQCLAVGVVGVDIHACSAAEAAAAHGVDEHVRRIGRERAGVGEVGGSCQGLGGSGEGGGCVLVGGGVLRCWGCVAGAGPVGSSVRSSSRGGTVVSCLGWCVGGGHECP